MPKLMTAAEIESFFARLQKIDPHPKTELEYNSPYTLLVAVALSAQATDKSVNKATGPLFKAVDTPEKMLALGEASLAEAIKTIGLYKGKAKNVIALSRILIEQHGGTSLGEAPAKAWEHGRYDAPYLRDSLLKAGALCETLETATTWSNVPTLKSAVTSALTEALTASGTAALVMCHISHVYPTGASLYFTIVAGQRGDVAAQWRSAKHAASDAIIANGGTITHHHAVGIDHKPWMSAEIGELGVQILRAVKQTLDPAGILNPGKLIP